MRFLLVICTVIGHCILYTVAQDGENTTNGLRCYACMATGGNNICEDYYTYEQAMDGTGFGHVKKDCTYPYNETCMIETFEVLSNTVSHIRGCSDGKQFSFSSNIQASRGAYTRLQDLTTNNETACVWDGQHLVCLSKCDADFCNGPQLTEVSSALWNNPSLFLTTVLLLCMNVICKHLS